jgi:hypothetical protein
LADSLSEMAGSAFQTGGLLMRASERGEGANTAIVAILVIVIVAMFLGFFFFRGGMGGGTKKEIDINVGTGGKSVLSIQSPGTGAFAPAPQRS